MGQPNGSGLNHPLIWAGVIGATLGTLYLVNAIWWLAFPFLLSAIFYYVSRPLVMWMTRSGLTHGQALGVYLGLLLLLTLVVVLAVIPFFTGETLSLQEKAPEYLSKLKALAVNTAVSLESRFEVFREANLAAEIEARIDGFFDGFAREHLSDVLMFVLAWIPSLLLVPYLAFFFLRDGIRFKKLIMRGVPNAFFEKVLLLIHRINVQIHLFFRGLMMMTLLDAITLGAGLWLLGLGRDIFPLGQAMLLGLICAVLAWMPYVGSVLGCLLVVIVCAIDAPDEGWLVLAAVGLFVFVRLLDDFFYTPLTVGKSMSVHPLLTVLVIFSGGVIAYLPGLLLAMPVLGVFMVLGEVIGQVWMDTRLQARFRHAKALKMRRAAVELG
ncbi:MAG: AI-2E family transporter [Candidatus Methylacidiphilales bacterium]